MTPAGGGQQFTRTFGPRSFTVSTPTEISDWSLEAAGSLFCDASSGSWRPGQFVHELASQLGIADQVANDPAELDQRSEAQRRLDHDTAGDHLAQRIIAQSSTIAASIAGRPATTVWILLPSDGSALDRTDRLLVEVLDDALAGTAHSIRLYYAGAGEPALPDGWRAVRSAGSAGPGTVRADPPPLAVLPGLLTPDIANCLTGQVDFAESCIELAAGCWLVDPARRSVDPALASQLADRLSEQVGSGLPMLAAVLQARSDTDVDPWLLVAQAAQQIGQGGDRLPHELLDRARAAMPTPGKAALCDLLGRSLDLVHGRFAEVAAQGPPSKAIKPWLQGMLWHVHGWALTMSGQAADALPALAHSRTILGEVGTVDEYLSTLNIAALARLRAGDWDGAWAAELELQGLLAELAPPNYQLSYINAMNMARLQRRSNDIEGQREHFDRAFETARGLRSDSDGIHENVTRARLETAPELARAAFLRAAVLLLSCRWPDAISPRILSALPRQDPSAEPRPAGSVEPETGFVDVLARRLAGCLRAPDDGSPPDPLPELTFRRAADLPIEVLEEADWRLYAVPGCLLAVTDLALRPVTSSPGLAELAGVVSGYLDLPAGATVLVDDRLGCEIPSDIWEIVAIAVRLGVRLTGDGHSLTADAGQRSALIAGARASLAPGVAALERDEAGQLIARFRRILPPAVLDEGASIVLLRLRDSPDASLLELAACLGSGYQDSYRLLRELEDARLVQLRY